MTAAGLLAWWKVNAAAVPVDGTESKAVADLRLGQLAALPVIEREQLMRLLGDGNPLSGGSVRQKGSRTWLQ
jgi:hypothetical protein